MADDVVPPRMFGGLLAALGFMLAIGGAQLSDIEGGGNYFVVVGIGALISGLLLYSGKKLALFAYGVTLAVIWIWTLKEADGDMAVIIPRIALPTLLAFYIYSYRIKSRLA
jgi:glucose dehydrogenase